MDRRRRIVYANERFAHALGLSVDQLLNRRCEGVLRLRDGDGDSFCGRHCLLDDPDQWCRLSTVAEPNDGLGELQICLIEEDRLEGGPLLLHLADARDEESVIGYVQALAHRSADLPDSIEQLTPSERRVLDALCRDLTAPQIAAEQHCSTVTVRNHIQHILRKMGAHSIPEAVARHLLRAEESGD